MPDVRGRAVAAVLLSCAVLLASCGVEGARANSKKVIVLGVDGMDPGFVERHWSELPNLARLRDKGSFHRLGTTNPPQSPVAWSTFITGLEPGAHGIFDFVHRDAQTRQPFSSMSKTVEPRFTLPLGPYRLPLSDSQVLSLRRGEPFWQILARRGVPVTVLRMPTNYPPVDAGEALAGMGAPDMAGTQGTFAFFTDDPEELDRAVAGGHIFKINVDGGHVVLAIPGPPNTLRKDEVQTTANLTVDVDPQQALARLSIGDQMAVIREGEWSDWLAADFTLLPHLALAHGMFRVFAKQLHPGFQLYVSPVNVDPLSPALPVSNPSSYGKAVAQEIGRYFTLGIPEDTAALRQGVFTLPQFLSQTHLIAADEQRLLRYALAHFDGGLLFFYFSTVDENSHMLWGRHEPELLRIYRDVDSAVGEVMRREPDADLIVMSDHGFTSFDRAVNLNTWLYERGFLSLNGTPGPDASIANADWSSTEAYALGLNGLYINLAGREKNGSVQPGAHRDAILANLREQLLAFRDADNGRQVVTSVFATHAAVQNEPIAPDLIVGYAPGYRGSWQTGLGGVPAPMVEDNLDAWIGDHCIDPAAVPGVLFTNRPAANPNPRLQDVTVSVLASFGVTPGAGMHGRSVY